MAAVDDRRQLRAGQRAAHSLAEHVPLAAGLVIDDDVAIGAEGERLPCRLRPEDAGVADVARVGDCLAVQRGGSAGLEEDDDRLTADGVLHHKQAFQYGEWIGDRLAVQIYRHDAFGG